MDTQNQREKILSYMNKHGSITPDEAFQAFHTHKLASRISELLDQGYPIEKNWVYKALPNGGKKKVHMEYSLRREE